ncbi:MAG: ATP-dependent helicase HrpB [Bdellovibrionaceae bacterium]|nr:ATP-dependent helicase HrpB [Pseudobdellovibrionaceae bacterium]
MNPNPKIPLPIDASLPDLERLFRESQNLVISAAPGSGKTTRVPPAIMNWTSGQVLVLEPRRVAALAAATRIAEENNWILGNEVGYQVRFENKTSNKTRLKFLTEALLVRQMLGDPELKGVDVVILDEFHERSSHVDLALGLLRELQQMGHSIKIIVMSATLDTQKISEFMGQAPILDVPGRLFPLDFSYDQRPQHLRILPEFYARLTQKIKEQWTKTSHDILVFLPGVGEIHRTESMLTPWISEKGLLLQTLYAQKPLAEQREILRSHSRQRVILTTNLAESALTIDGVGAVIDTGLERRVEFDERTETEKISLQRISKASAQQRAGRAARQFPGHCLRLWTKSDELSFPAQIPAEILKTDLSPSLLFLSAQGVLDFECFSWFEKPANKSIAWAQQELFSLGAISADNRITDLGRKMLLFPVPPRLAKMLVLAQDEGVFEVACELVALMHEKDILTQTQTHSDHIAHSGSHHFESDLLERWTLWQENSSVLQRRNLEQVEKVAASLKRLHLPPPSKRQSTNDVLNQLQKLLALTFADRLCRRRQPGSERGLRCGGRGVSLTPESMVKRSMFFIPLKSIDLGSQKETLVSWASGLSLEQLTDWFPQDIKRSSRVVFDPDRRRLVRQTQSFYRDLPIDEPTITEPTAEEIQAQFPAIIQSYWTTLIKQNEGLNKWIARLEAFSESQKDSNIFTWSLSPEVLSQVCEELAVGHSTLAEIEAVDIPRVLDSHLPAELRAYWQKEWPLRWQAPSGRWIPIHYQQGQNPYVEIKIQELFGLKIQPKMFGNSSPLVFQLLAPNQRPVQITSDIVGFWSGSYKDVKKELKPRYPKHNWTDDPLNEAPELPRVRPHRKS